MPRYALLAVAMVLTACSDGPGAPALKESEPAAVRVSPAAVVLAPGDTVRFTAEVLDGRGRTLPASAVSWQVTNSEIAVIDTDGRLTAVARGTASVTVTSGQVQGTAAVDVRNRSPLVLDTRDVVIADLGGVHEVKGTVDGARVSSLTFAVLDEARWLTERAVVKASGNDLVGEAPGRVRLLVSAPAAVPDTLTVTVSAARPVVFSITAPVPAAATDSVVLRGYLPAVDASQIRVDNAPATVLRTDSAHVVLRAGEAPATRCEAGNRARIDFPAALAHVPLEYVRLGEDEITLRVGEALIPAAAQLACLRTRPTPGAEYLLAFYDASSTELQRRGATSYLPDYRFQASVRDRVGPAAPAPAPLRLDPPALRHDVHVDSAPSALASRTVRWTVGERFTLSGHYGVHDAQVVAIYDNHFVLAVPVGEVEFFMTRIKAGFDTAMAYMLTDGFPLLQAALAPGRPSAGPVGQDLLFAQRADMPDWVDVAGGSAGMNHSEYRYGAAILAQGWVAILAHEMAHRWHFTMNTAVLQPHFGQWGSWRQWNVEGLASYLEYEILRRYARQPFLDNIPLDFSRGPAYLWMQHSHGSIEYFRGGYQSVANFLRDVTQRLRTEQRMSQDDAVITVARGAATGWYGCATGTYTTPRCAPEGLAEAMSRVGGGEWDPAQAILTWHISQVADDRTDNPVFQNLTWYLRTTGSGGRAPAGTVRSGSGAHAVVEANAESGGHFLLIDDGSGGAFTASLDIPGGRWMLFRIR